MQVHCNGRMIVNHERMLCPICRGGVDLIILCRCTERGSTQGLGLVPGTFHSGTSDHLM